MTTLPLSLPLALLGAVAVLGGIALGAWIAGHCFAAMAESLRRLTEERSTDGRS